MIGLNYNVSLKLAVVAVLLVTAVTAPGAIPATHGPATFDQAITPPSPPLLPAGWGIDAVLTRHVQDDADFDAYVTLLHDSGVRWLRERGVRNEPREQAHFRALRDAEFATSAFVYASVGGAPQSADNHLPEHLLAVYQGSYEQAKANASVIQAWEMLGEPDMGYCRDLPERLTAFNKAMYLGLKDGARDAGRSTTVLMGAMGLPPGPWMARATANGIFAYTDAANIHFYGLAPELRGAIAAHRAFIREHVSLAGREPRAAGCLAPHEHGWQPPHPAYRKRPAPLNLRPAALPIWITECGIKLVSEENFHDPVRRAAQRDFTVETALTAWREPDVAVFMPFILVWKKDGHTMTMSPTEHFPAWTAYEKITRERSWPADRVMTRPPIDPSRLIMQWLPDEGQGRTHKVSGTYRFTAGGAITGAIRLYNLGDTPRRGRLEWADGEAFTASAAPDGELTVPPMGMVEVPVVFTPRTERGYFREEWRAECVPTDGAGETWPVVFGLERLPVAEDFEITPLPVAPAPSADWTGFAMKPEVVTSASGPWRGRNGVEIVSASERDVSGVFKVTAPQTHPMQPPSVAVRLAGLPEDGLLLVRSNQPLVPWRRVRVDLFDDRGQRYTQWENGGMDYHGDGSEMWLSLRDFHIYFWGVTTADYRFDPKRIVELQLRFYLYDPADEMAVTVDLATPRGVGK